LAHRDEQHEYRQPELGITELASHSVNSVESRDTLLK